MNRYSIQFRDTDGMLHAEYHEYPMNMKAVRKLWLRLLKQWGMKLEVIIDLDTLPL